MASVLAGLLLVLLGATPVAQAAPPSFTECSTELYHDDRRLGPERLPLYGPVGSQLYGYSRTGYRPVAVFLERYYDPTANSWRYPPNDGYALGPDGQPIKWTDTLDAGEEIDRYGSEFGGFLAPRGAAYTTRAIPPSNLVGTPAAGCNYHVYEVLRPFDVQAGPIAAWFFQRGGGLQYQLTGALVPGAPAQLNVKWLLENGYLERII
jgi:hypothetical protein